MTAAWQSERVGSRCCNWLTVDTVWEYFQKIPAQVDLEPLKVTLPSKAFATLSGILFVSHPAILLAGCWFTNNGSSLNGNTSRGDSATSPSKARRQRPVTETILRERESLGSLRLLVRNNTQSEGHSKRNRLPDSKFPEHSRASRELDSVDTGQSERSKRVATVFNPKALSFKLR